MIIPIIIYDAFFILLKYALPLVIISFCSPIYCEDFELTDNKFTILTNPVKNKHLLTSPIKIKFSDNSHHYLWCFLYIVKIRFTPSNHLLLFSHLLWRFRIVRSICILCMLFSKFYSLLQCLSSSKFERSTHSQARVSKAHFWVHNFVCFLIPYLS